MVARWNNCMHIHFDALVNLLKRNIFNFVNLKLNVIISNIKVVSERVPEIRDAHIMISWFWVQDFAEVNEFFLDLGGKISNIRIFFLLVDKYSTHYMIDEITWQWAQKKLAVMIVHSKKYGQCISITTWSYN